MLKSTGQELMCECGALAEVAGMCDRCARIEQELDRNAARFEEDLAADDELREYEEGPFVEDDEPYDSWVSWRTPWRPPQDEHVRTWERWLIVAGPTQHVADYVAQELPF